MSEDIFISLGNIEFLRIEIGFIENEINIVDFLHEVNFNHFKKIGTILLDNINTDEFKILLKAKERKDVKENKTNNKSFFIEIRKNQINLYAPPFAKDFDYKENIQDLFIDTDNLNSILYKINKNKIEFYIKGNLFFKLNNEDLINTFKTYLEKISSSCKDKLFNGILNGLSIKIPKENENEKILLEMDIEEKKGDTTFLISLHSNEKSIIRTFADIDIKKFIENVLNETNNFLNSYL